MKERLLVIGGGGFIGSELILKLADSYDITVVDIVDKENSYLANFHGMLNYVKGNSMDSNIISELGNDYNYIVHCSAVLGIKRVGLESINTITTNVGGCKEALELATRQKNLKKFVTFSTSEVYGVSANDVKEEMPAVINSAVEPRWCYAASKMLSEHFTTAYSREKDISVLIIRPFNVYSEKRNGTNAMTTFIERALKNEKIFIDGDGSQKRAWCHIDDFISGLIPAIFTEKKVSIYNIGNPKEYVSILELAQKVISMTGSNSEIIFRENKEDVYDRLPNIDNARRELNYEPQISLVKGIQRIIDFKLGVSIL